MLFVDDGLIRLIKRCFVLEELGFEHLEQLFDEATVFARCLATLEPNSIKYNRHKALQLRA